MSAAPRIILVGAGFASLETAFLLRHTLGDRVDLTLVADADSFVFKPTAVRLPFGDIEQRCLRVPLRTGLRRRQIAFHHGRVAAVEPSRQVVRLTDGRFLRYDYLVIGTGARPHPEEVPGLEEHASTGWSPEAMRRLGTRLEALRTRATRGERIDLLFVVPPHNTCSSPLYELVLLTESWLRRHHVRDCFSLACSTAEPRYLSVHGPGAHRVISAEFARREIAGHPAEVVEKVLDGEAVFAGGATRYYDEIIAFPSSVAALDYAPLPVDDRGFLITVPETLQVVGQPTVFAPGDGGDFPVRLASAALLQAAAVAGHLGRELGGRPFDHPFRPGTSSLVNVLGGAAFVPAPLRLPDPTGGAAATAGRDPVGVSPFWRLSQRALGGYVPMRFRAGRPVQLGPGATVLEAAAHRLTRALPRAR